MTRSSIRRALWSAAVIGAFTVTPSRIAGAETAPPVQGTMSLEGTMKTFYRAANVVIVTTVDGVEHAYRFAKDLVVHGGRGSGVDTLEGLREGTTVVVHYTVEGSGQAAREVDVIGASGLTVTEGVVVRHNRRRKEITVRYDNGKTEVFRLTDRAASEVLKAGDTTADDGSRVVIYYSDEHGRRVAHFFRATR